MDPVLMMTPETFLWPPHSWTHMNIRTNIHKDKIKSIHNETDIGEISITNNCLWWRLRISWYLFHILFLYILLDCISQCSWCSVWLYKIRFCDKWIKDENDGSPFQETFTNLSQYDSPHVLFPPWSKLGCKVTSTGSKALQDHVDHTAKD